ncbi:MAG TPA: SIR2 family protein [Candidatus Angelobacter sp.]|nr:SIR2 family protein [Candidatus Angelobacter sp.]
MDAESLKKSNEIIERVEQVLQATYEGAIAFNLAFNGDKPIKIPSPRLADGYQLEASEILFWVDRSAYFEEYEAWQQSSTQEIHQGAIDQLKANGQTGEFHDLVSAIKRNRIAPFIGAGVSYSCGYPMWAAALHELSHKIDGVDLSAFGAKMAAYEYLGAAQLLWDKDEIQVKNFIRTKFDEQPIRTNGIKGPIKLLASFSRGCIITTNFDHLIELTLGPTQIDGYMHGNQQGHMFVPRLISGDRCILKLHGDSANYNTFVFTENQYTESYGVPLDFAKPLPKALRQIFVSHSLLFLGCSLEQDRTLELFQKICDDKQFDIPDHFAILPLPADNSSKIVKESRLLKLNIRPLWYSPFNNHELVEKYLALAVDMADGRIAPF